MDIELWKRAGIWAEKVAYNMPRGDEDATELYLAERLLSFIGHEISKTTMDWPSEGIRCQCVACVRSQFEEKETA